MVTESKFELCFQLVDIAFWTADTQTFLLLKDKVGISSNVLSRSNIPKNDKKENDIDSENMISHG